METASEEQEVLSTLSLCLHRGATRLGAQAQTGQHHAGRRHPTTQGHPGYITTDREGMTSPASRHPARHPCQCVSTAPRAEAPKIAILQSPQPGLSSNSRLPSSWSLLFSSQIQLMVSWSEPRMNKEGHSSFALTQP